MKTERKTSNKCQCVSELGTVLGTISASGGTAGPVRYSSNSSTLAVSSISGVVTLQTGLDYSVRP
jgi:hypothetical protein